MLKAIKQNKTKKKEKKRKHTFSKGSTDFQDNPSEFKLRMTSPTLYNKRVELKMDGLRSKDVPGRDLSLSPPKSPSFPSLSINK